MNNEFESYIELLDSLPFLTRQHWHDFGWSHLYKIGNTDYYINAEFGKGDLRCYKSPKAGEIILFDFEDVFNHLPQNIQDQIIFNINLFR